MTATNAMDVPLEEGEKLVRLGWAYGSPGSRRTFAAGAWLFAFTGSGDPEDALRAAAAEYFARPTEDCAEQSCGSPNWGDAIQWVPDEIWAHHGLRRLTVPVDLTVSVDHDELFEMGEPVAS